MADDKQAAEMIALGTMLSSLRHELQRAQKAGSDDDMKFLVEQVELELELAVGQESGGDGKVSFSVLGFNFGLGGKHNRKNTTTHKIKLSLKPVSKSTGERTLVSNEGISNMSDD